MATSPKSPAACFTLIPELADFLGLTGFPRVPTGVDVFLPFLNRARSEGAVIVFKMDGARVGPGDNGPYTAVISGPPLGQEFFRTDTDTLEEALAYVLIHYAIARWGFDPF